MQRFLLVLLAVLVTAPTARAWTWPADGPLLRPFVFGSDPYLGGQHRGIDVAGAAGAPVRAAAGGTVTFAGSLPGAGKTVTVQTADGYAVTHVHLGGISATEGSVIAEGAKVGTIGPSGEPEVDRPYVHLGVRVAAERHGYVDPLKLLPRRKTVAPPSAPKPPAATAPAPVKPAPPRVVTPKPAPKPAPVVRAPSPSPVQAPPPVVTPKPALKPAPVGRAPSPRPVQTPAPVARPKPAPEHAPVGRTPSPRPVQVPAPVVTPKPAPKPAPIVRAPSPRPVQAPTRPAKPVSAPAPRASVRPPGEKPTPEARSKAPVVRPVPEVKPRSTAPGAPRSAPERRQSVLARAKLAPPVFKLSEPDATPSSTKTRRGHASPSAVKTKPVPHEEASPSALSRLERKREVGERAAPAAPSPALVAAAGDPAAAPASAAANVAESPAARETEEPSDAALGDRGAQGGTPTAALPAGQASPSIVALPETTAATSVGSPAPASGASEQAVEAGAAVGSAEAGATVPPQISRPASRADARPAAQAATALAGGARPLWPAREQRREPQDGNPVAPAAAPAPRARARAARHAAPEPVGNASRDARKIGQPVAASDGSRVLYLLAGLLLAAGILVLAFRHRRPLGLPGRKRPRPASMPPALDAVAAEGSDEPWAAPAPAGGEDAIGLPPARTEPMTAASPSEALEGALCRRVRSRRSSRGVRPPRSRDHAARRHADRLTTSR